MVPYVEKSLFTDNHAVLTYYKVGNGKKNMLAFHGFGQDHTVFEPLITALQHQYTFYLFDLFFHGKSTWPKEDEPLTRSQWRNTMRRFISENRLEQFSIAGFSIGARFALALLEDFPQQVEKVFLIAPDGINTSFWYNLATYPMLMRRLFKSMITHGNRFTFLMNVARRLRLADKRLLLFAELQMNTEEKRKRVYGSWITFRLLKFDLGELARLINTFSTPVLIIAGKRDAVISPQNMKVLLRQCKHCHMHVLNATHNRLLINEKLALLMAP